MTHVCDPVSMPIHICDRGLSDYHSLSPEPRSPPGVGSIAAAVEAMIMMMIHHLAFTFPLLITLSGGVGCKTCFFILTLPGGQKTAELHQLVPSIQIESLACSAPEVIRSTDNARDFSQVIECRAGLVNWEVITRR